MRNVVLVRRAVLVLLASAMPAAAQSAGAPVAPANVQREAPPPDAMQARPRPQGYVIGPDDVLEVQYWRDKDLSAEAVVRPDGFISLPLLHDVQAVGLTPEALAATISGLAAAYLEVPDVTVVVKQINSRKVFITGEVVKPGPYPLNAPTTVLQLIALAGGLTPYADRDQIAIIRASTPGDNGKPVTLRFSYKKATQLKDLSENVGLLPGDTVLVR